MGILNKIVIAVIFFILIIVVVILQPLPQTPPSTLLPVVSPTPSSSLYLDQYGIRGDSTNEGPALQAALDYAASHSIQTVIFPAGKVITTGGLNFPGGITYLGNGCTLRLEAGTHTDIQPWTWIRVYEGGSLSGFKFDGNRFNNNGWNTDGIMLRGDNIFNNNEVFNVASYPVFIYGNYPSNIRITNNQIWGSEQYGITTGGSDGPYSWGYNVTVTGNTLWDCKEVGIKIRGTKDSIITDNIITVGARRSADSPGGNGKTGDEPSGIRLYSWDETNTNVTISNNVITGLDQNPSTCINSDDSNNVGISITGNTVSRCDEGINIHFNNGIITGNTISDCTTPLHNGGSGNTITGNTITGNTISHCYEGIVIHFNNGTISNNTVSDCQKSIINSGNNNTIHNNTLLASSWNRII